MTSYDAFLSYSREDLDAVTAIAERLRDEAQLAVWFDQWEIVAGDEWQTKMDEGLRSARTCVVLIGPKGLGRWQAPEAQVALNMKAERGIRVVPVLLPGVANDDDRIPSFLKILHFCVLTSLTDQGGFERIWAGIIGRHPRAAARPAVAPRPVREEPADPNDEPIAYLQRHLAGDAISFFVGRGLVDHATPCDISEQLLRSLDLIGVNEQPPTMLPSLDLAASYYAVKIDERMLESDVATLLRQPRNAPAAYTELAGLLKALAGREVVRGRHRFRYLVMTSALDTLIEQAFLRAGLGFTRFVQSRSGTRLDVNIYDRVEVAPGGRITVTERGGHYAFVAPDDPDQLDQVIADTDARSIDAQGPGGAAQAASDLSRVFEELREPILYKLHGSQDVPDSCTLSTEQYYDAVSRAPFQKSVPEQVTQILSNTPIVFLGCRILDPDFRLSYYLLRQWLEARRGSIRRFAVQARGLGDKRDCGHQMDLRAWNRLANWAVSRYGIEMLDLPCDDFLRRLRRRLGQ